MPQSSTRSSSIKVIKPPADTKALLEKYYRQYCTTAFIKDDPIQFPHQFKSTPRQTELVGLLAALFSYGRRNSIIQSITELLDRMNGDPLLFLELPEQKQKQQLKGFIYRFYTADDVLYLCQQLSALYNHHETLGDLWQYCQQTTRGSFLETLALWHSQLWGTPSPKLLKRSGLKFMLPSPVQGGACKRFNMFFRWMSRKDNVDLGLWQNVLTPDQIYIPLDVHVGRQARALGLLSRKYDDWQSVVELSDNLRLMDFKDPIKYDFSLFGYGIEQSQLVKK